MLRSNRIALRLASTLVGFLVPAWTKVGAQGLPTPLPPSNPAPIVYCPPERLSAGPASPYHVLNVFLPRGAVPASGWPVVIATGYGGGASVPAASALSSTGPSAPLWNLVAAGIAVVHFGTPGLGNNRGLWYPAGHPSGRYESFRPLDDNPEKSAEWALQWTKVQTLFSFDVTRVGLRGSSGGAVLAIRTAMGPDRARASGSAQVRASTRVAAILAIQPPTSAWALEQGPELLIPFPKHLEQAARPGIASTVLAQAAPEMQKDYSLMRVAFASAEARANNAHQALCLVYGDPVLRIGGAVAPFDLDATGFPILHDLIKQPLQHDSWFGYVFWKRLIELSPDSAAFHAANSVFVMRDVYALAPPLAYHTRTYRGTVMGAQAARIGHEWLLGRLLGPQRSTTSAPPSPLMSTTSALTSGCETGREGSLLLLEGEARPGARLALGLRGPRGATAVLALALAPLSGCGARTVAGALRLDPSALLRPLVPVRLGEVDGVPTLVRLEIPLRTELVGLELYAQALVLEGREPWLTDALALPVGR